MGFGDLHSTEQQQNLLQMQQQQHADAQHQQQAGAKIQHDEPSIAVAGAGNMLLLEGPILVTLPAQPFVFVCGVAPTSLEASEMAWKLHSDLPAQFREQFMLGSAAVGTGLWGTTSRESMGQTGNFTCRAGRCVANLPPAAMPLPPSVQRGDLAGGLYSCYTMYGDAAMLGKAWEAALQRSGSGISGAVLNEDVTRERLAHYFSTPLDPRGAINVSIIHLYIPTNPMNQLNRGSNISSTVEYSLTEPELLEMEPFRMVFMEDSGKFAQICHPLWEGFNNNALPHVLPGGTLQKCAAAFIKESESDDLTGYGGKYRAGAILPPGYVVQPAMMHAISCSEDTVGGVFLRFTLLGEHRHLPLAWARCLAAARQHKIAASLDTANRPCIEMYLQVSESKATITELLVPIVMKSVSNNDTNAPTSS